MGSGVRKVRETPPGHCLFIHRTFLGAYCEPGFAVDTGNLEKQILFLGLSFSWPRMETDAI